MLFDNNDVDLDFALFNLTNMPNISKKDMNDYSSKLTNSNILSAKEGFLRWNLFKNEYEPYKNMTYIDIKPKNDREAMLFNVMQYSFAINDLNLWLDLHPRDNSVLALFKEMVEEARKAKREYETKYGPLTVSHTKGNEFDWIDSPWPWEDLGGSMYV